MTKTFTCSMQKKKESFAKKSEGVEALKDKVVSDGTLKPEDLIPKFLNALKHDETAHAKFLKDNPEILEIQSWDDVDDETKSMLVDELTDALNDIAPDGYFFGASDGDGACFGFWAVDPDESKQPEAKTCEATFKQGVDDFISCAPSGGWSDYWAMQQDWEFYKDSLCRDGVITQKQADSWSNPCTPETFARWQKRNGLVSRGYESKKSEDTYDRPVTLYASTRYDDAEEAQKFLDSISGGEVKVSKERNGDTLSVSIEGDGDAIDTFLAVYKDNYDTLEKDCDADVNGWTDPVDLKYYTVQGRKELTGESCKKSEACKGGKDDDKKDGKAAESKKSEGYNDTIKMGIDYNMFMRMCRTAAYLDEDEDYWDALWEYYSEMGEIPDALEFFDNLFQYTAWCDVDELYDEYLDDAYKDKSKSKETCIQEAVDGGDLGVYKHSSGKYLVVL